MVACNVGAAVFAGVCDPVTEAVAVRVVGVLTGGVVDCSVSAFAVAFVGAFVAGEVTAVAAAAATAVVTDAVPATVGTGKAVAVGAASVGEAIGVGEGIGVTVMIGSLLHAASNMLKQAKNGTRSWRARRHGTVANSLQISTQPYARYNNALPRGIARSFATVIRMTRHSFAHLTPEE